jgi:SNF2 family DNA or RNA helicase
MTDFLEGSKKDVLVVKYDSMRGTRKKVEGKFDAEGNPVEERERLSEEIRTFCKIFRQHRQKIVLVLDECHKFKSDFTQNRNLVFNLARFPERVWALTATVIKNGLEEFYAIATALGIRPLGFMGDFRSEYCEWREQYVGNGITKKLITGYKNVPAFIRELRPFFLGRSQRQVKEPLPRLTTVYHPIDLDARQSKILLDELPNGTLVLPPTLIRDACGVWHEKERDADNLMTQLSIQQLVANHWALIDRSNEADYLTRKLSPKEEALLDMLDGDYRGEKVVVYTKYRSWIDRLQWLTENGHFTSRKFLRITGAESEKQRNENKKLFQSPDSGYDLIVINAAGMEGINLQQAAHMILLDVPWSWGDLIQLVGRMVRMASPHAACTLHVMISKGTIDEYAIETLRGKKGVFEKILGQSHSAGILDTGDAVLDLGSGMEGEGTEEEFRALLRAHCKKIGMKTFLSGEQIARAQGDTDYKMAFERGSKAKRRSHKDSYEDLKWFLE